MSPTERAPEPAADAAADPVVSVRGLHKAFGSHEVLRGVDLDVHAGEVVAVIGSSGSGKTTLLRCLNGLEVADSGTLALRGGPTIDLGARPAGGRGARGRAARRELDVLRDRSAMVFQHYNLFPHKTALENVTEGPVVVQRRPPAQARAEALELLDRVGLADRADAYPFQLSGGQQQRVGIVRALALRPELLLFDEPTSALDPEIVGDVLVLMRDLAAEGWTMVVVTHELQFAREVAHRVAFVDGGAILEQGPARQVLGDPRHERTRQFIRRLLHPL